MIKEGIDKQKIGVVVVLVLVFICTLVYAYLQYFPTEKDKVSVVEDEVLSVSKKDKIISYKEAYAKRLESIEYDVSRDAQSERKNEVEIDFTKLLKSSDEKASPVEKAVEIPENNQEREMQSQIRSNKSPVKLLNTPKSEVVTIINEDTKKEIREDNKSKTIFVRNTKLQKQVLLSDTSSSNAVNKILIPAIVYGDQKVKSGSMVRMRTNEAVLINGISIPANTFVIGTVKLAKERIHIEVGRIENELESISIQLSAFDIDGMEGLYAPEHVEQAIAKNATNSALNGVRSTVNLPVIGSISLNTGKRKLSDVEVKIPNRYKLILKAK